MTEEVLPKSANNIIVTFHDIPANRVIPANAGIQINSNDMAKQPAAYGLSNERNNTLYVDVTRNLPARIWK